jgi:DNA-directed RNA polymerase sigma subunit (sigma70/sigma32)
VLLTAGQRWRTWWDLVADPSLSTPEDVTERDERHNGVQAALSLLNPRQRDVVALRFGIEDGQERSRAEVGRLLGFSRERAPGRGGGPGEAAPLRLGRPTRESRVTCSQA